MYIVDLGLRRHLLARGKYDLGFSLENIIYFELLRCGYSVNIGKVGTTEIDLSEPIIHEDISKVKNIDVNIK